MSLVNSRMVRGRCPCGAEHAACGPPSTSESALDQLEVAAVGGPLKLYDVVMHGVPTRMKLNEADAQRYAATLVEPEEAPAPEQEPTPLKAPAKKRAASNKARRPAAKDGGADGGDD